jgi:purine-nucleoside/S-methyl-5'-thioadenosine phosphorylase / adenosine deaminase
MIVPPGVRGVAFGTRSLGDGRSDVKRRAAISSELGIAAEWATITQVHGARVVLASKPGHYGEADALVTGAPGLPIAIATADCVPVVLVGDRSRAVAHAGWRGVAAGVVPAAVKTMRSNGDAPVVAVLGPHIGPCCYEVGREVVDAIGGFSSRTRSGSLSVDLGAAVRSQLGGIETIDMDRCTHDDTAMASYREDGTSERQVTIAWIPQD